MQDLLGCPMGSVEVEGEAGFAQGRLDPRQVRDGILGDMGFPVVGREGPLVTAEERETFLLAVGPDQRRLKGIGPGARGLRELLFQNLDLDLRDLALSGLDDDMQTREQGVAQLRREGCDLAGVGLG